MTTDPAVPLHRASWAPQLEKPYSQPSDSLGSRAEDEASWGLEACRSLGRTGSVQDGILDFMNTTLFFVLLENQLVGTKIKYFVHSSHTQALVLEQELQLEL